MKKYHLLILVLLLCAYAWLYYQKNHSGADIYDWFRAKSKNDSFTKLLLNPNAIVGQSVTFYGEISNNLISENGYFNSDFDKPVYFRKDRNEVLFDCAPDHIKITGIVNKHQEYFYFESITEISGYQSDRTHPNHGMSVFCNQVE